MLFIIGHGTDKNLAYLMIAPGKPVYMTAHWTMNNATDYLLLSYHQIVGPILKQQLNLHYKN